MFWFPRVCQNPLKGAIPDPAPIKRVGNLPSTNGLKWKPGLDFKYMATFSPTGMFAKKFEQNPPNFSPVSVWYSTTLSKRSKRTVLSPADFERYSLELAMLYNLWRQHRIFLKKQMWLVMITWCCQSGPDDQFLIWYDHQLLWPLDETPLFRGDHIAIVIVIWSAIGGSI